MTEVVPTRQRAASGDENTLTPVSSGRQRRGSRPLAARPTPPHRYYFQDRIRAWVSKKKRRFRGDGFDLDLTYVTDKLIAMGFPAVNHEAAYRNSAVDIESFLDKFYGIGNYKLYNLCAERTYPAERFHGQFVRFPFEDHNPPPLGMIYFFCVDCDELLTKPNSVAAIHCKAGKGRTGVMIAAYMLWQGDWATPDDAMQFYGFARTNNQKGITIPSQRRFVTYFFETIKNFRSGVPSSSTTDSDDPLLLGESREVVHQAVRQETLAMSTGEEDDSDTDLDEDEGRIAPHALLTLSDDPPSPLHQLDDDDDGSQSSCVVVDRGAPRLPNSSDPPEFVPATPEDEKELQLSEETRADRVYESVANLAHSFEHLRRDGVPAFGGGAPTVRKAKHRLVNDEWNRQNRLHTKGQRGSLPQPKMLAIDCISLFRVRPNAFRNHFEPHFKIHCMDLEYDSSDLLAVTNTPTSFKAPTQQIDLQIPNALVVDEVCVTFYSKTKLGGKAKLFKFWFHTAFIEDDTLCLPKSELDSACKDKAHVKFDADFQIRLHFTDHFR